MCRVMLNTEFNGVELYFESKPIQNVIDELKFLRFRWHSSKKCWYAKQNESTMKIANKLSNTQPSKVSLPELKKKVKSFDSLFERTQFVDGKVDTSKYEYKFVGSNYTPRLSTKEIAAEARKHLKQRFPEVKFSIRCANYNSIRCEIISSPYNYKKLELEPYQYREFEKENNKELQAIVAYATNFIQSYNYDDSDSMSDYFDVNFYDGRCDISYDYIQTEQSEEIKNDIADFRLKLDELEEQRKIEMEDSIKKQTEQRKLDEIAYAERKKQDRIDIETINNNVNFIDLEDDKQYMVHNIKMAHCNKNNTIERYLEEIAIGEEAYCTQSMKVTREVHFETLEVLELFKNKLLCYFDFISGTGGTYTDDNTFTSITDYNHMTKAEKEKVMWNLYGIAVYCKGKLQFVIDAQGHNYARYVGITDDSKIESDTVVEEVTDQTQKHKEIADRIEDLSTKIIAENNIENFSSSPEYRNILIDTLRINDIILSKYVIRMIKLENLKIYLYELLSYTESVSKQFYDANIHSGDKITIIEIDDMIGSVNTTRVTFDKYEDCKYAQYNDAVKVIFIPERKRNQYYNYYHSNRNFLIVSGWVNIPEEILWETDTSETRLIFRKSKYLSCDIQQLIDIKNYLLNNKHKVLIDRTGDK